MKDKIFCLVGPSGVGKTTIAKELDKQGYNVIQSYTTRKPREENEWGHIFVNKFDNPRNIIVYTYYDNNHYWATKEQYQGKGNTIYVIDPTGVKKLKETIKDADIKVIYLISSPTTRVNRMQLDGRNNAYERLEVDKQAFRNVDHDIVISTDAPLPSLVDKVKEYIEGVK